MIGLRGWLRNIFAGFVWLLAATAVAQAQPELAKIAAYPALWTVHGPKGTAYLLGSIHILPPNMVWHTPQIDAALEASDVFVFEIPMDDATNTEIAAFVRDNGLLPKGQTLSSLLDAKAQKDYAAALALTHMPAAQLADKRPWLASLMLDVAYMTERRMSAEAGVDREVHAEAVAAGGKTFRAFETPEQQFRLFMPPNQKLEIAEFDSSLVELLHDQGSMGNLVDAWASGNAQKLGALAKADIGNHPEVEKALFDDRNRAWVKQIASMLNENHIYFITVGAGHLAGPKGVPALLRKAGFRVDGP